MRKCLSKEIYTYLNFDIQKLVINHFTHPTPKPDLNNLEEAILLDNKLITKCQHFAHGKQSLVVDSKGIISFQY